MSGMREGDEEADGANDVITLQDLPQGPILARAPSGASPAAPPPRASVGGGRPLPATPSLRSPLKLSHLSSRHSAVVVPLDTAHTPLRDDHLAGEGGEAREGHLSPVSDTPEASPMGTAVQKVSSPLGEGQGSEEKEEAEGKPQIGEVFPSPADEEASPSRQKRKKKKSKKQVLEEELTLARERMDRDAAVLKSADVLKRTGFAFDAWLEPQTEEQKELAEKAHQRKIMEQRKRSPEEEQLFHSLGRWRYCFVILSRELPHVATAAHMAFFGIWRLLFVLDYATDILAARETNAHYKAMGGFLGFLLFLPYLICGIGMFNSVVREVPRILRKHGVDYGGVEMVQLAYFLLAPLWVFIADMVITLRFAFWPVEGYYPGCFERMRRITMLVVDASLTTLIQIQVVSANVSHLRNNLLEQAVGVSICNLLINGFWLYRTITQQHKPWGRYIRDVFRGGLHTLPGLDDIREGAVEVEILDGIEHHTELLVLSQVVRDCGAECKLQKLTISRVEMNDEGVNALVGCLLTNRSIHTLILDHNAVKDAGIRHLGRALAQNSVLTSLSMSHNDIQDGGIREFAGVLRKEANCKLAHLDLSWNLLKADAAYSLSLALKHSRCDLTQLNLSHCALGNEGIGYLGRALTTNTKLTTLRVCSAGITDDGATAFAVALGENRTLQELALSGNMLKDNGCVAFWEVFAAPHPSLRRLELSGVGMTNMAGKVLAENMQFNPYLEFIDLSFNQLQADVIVEMAEALLQLPNLKVLLVAANSLSREEFREKHKTNEPVLGLTAGRNPRLRFQVFPT